MQSLKMNFSLRLGQMIIQTSLLIFLVSFFSTLIPVQRVLLLMSSCLFVQFFFDRHFLNAFNYRSAIITSLSLLLLLKTPTLALDALAALLAIGSKFLIKINRRHFFNPANFAIVVLMLLGWGWISPMQWGQEPFVLFFLVAGGSWLCYKANRLDVPLVFIAVTWTLMFHRHYLFLGDPLPVLFHRLSIVTLYVFSFLMISDPKTTPQRLGARMLWVSMVAIMSFVIENHYYVRHGTLYVLFGFAFFNGLLNKTLPGKEFVWKESAASY